MWQSIEFGVGEDDDVALFGKECGVPARAPFVEPGGHGTAVVPEEEWVNFLVTWGEGRGFYNRGLDVVGACAGECDDGGDLRGILGEVGGTVVGVAADFL